MEKRALKTGTLFFCLLVSGTLFAQNRYALVIGNNNYQNEVTTLTNPANDAEDIAAALRDLGYEVTLQKNVTLDQMIRAVDQFAASLSRDAESEGFFWFAGHGLSVKEQHYLLPIKWYAPAVLFLPRNLGEEQAGWIPDGGHILPAIGAWRRQLPYADFSSTLAIISITFFLPAVPGRCTISLT